MEDIINIDLSDDELMGTILPENKEVKKSEKIRTKTQEKYLDRAFACREILKWKYCYMEKNPREYSKFHEYRKKFKVDRRTITFKKMFRLAMDNEYHIDMLKIKKHMIKKELSEIDKEENDDKDSGIHQMGSIKDPMQLLKSYDRECERLTKWHRQHFMVYLEFPKCYPDIEQEKKIFDELRGENEQKSELESDWKKYWTARVPILCNEAIGKAKLEILNKWENLVSYCDINAFSEELETLTISDDEDDL